MSSKLSLSYSKLANVFSSIFSFSILNRYRKILFKIVDKLLAKFYYLVNDFLYFWHIEVEHCLNRLNILVDHPYKTYVKK